MTEFLESQGTLVFLYMMLALIVPFILLAMFLISREDKDIK